MRTYALNYFGYLLSSEEENQLTYSHCMNKISLKRIMSINQSPDHAGASQVHPNYDFSVVSKVPTVCSAGYFEFIFVLQ